MSKKSETVPVKKNIQKWGNSSGIRLPKQLLDELEMHEGDEVFLSSCDGVLLISKKEDKKLSKEWYVNRAIELLEEVSGK